MSIDATRIIRARDLPFINSLRCLTVIPTSLLVSFSSCIQKARPSALRSLGCHTHSRNATTPRPSGARSVGSRGNVTGLGPGQLLANTTDARLHPPKIRFNINLSQRAYYHAIGSDNGGLSG